MSALGDYRATIAERLRTTPGLPAGVAVSRSPASGPPVILVDLLDGLAPQGIGAWQCELAVRCIVQPPGDQVAAALLEEMAEHVLLVLGFAPFSRGTYRPTADIELPAYTFLYPAVVPNPNC